MTPLSLTRSCIVSCLGAGQAAHLAALRADRSGLSVCDFETADIKTYAGAVAGVEDVALPPEFAEFDCRNNRLADLALAQDGFRQAVAAAREKYGPQRIGVFLGTSTSGILEAEHAYQNRDAAGTLPDFNYAGTHNTFSLAEFVRRSLGLEGPALVVSSACASSTKTFGNAARMIGAGLCDAAIIGGADSLCLTTLYGFHSLQLTSTLPCRPFDAARDGISIGEGAGFALLEKMEAADAGPEWILRGVGESNDAYHMSAPHPEGLGGRLAMERALGSAGMSAADIGYVKLHGTATPAGDAAEDNAVSGLFGNATPCSSLKGFTGHTLGASGIVEAIMTGLGLRHGFMPGSPHTEDVDPACKSRYLRAALKEPVETALCNSFGFGGSNCCLILGRAA